MGSVMGLENPWHSLLDRSGHRLPGFIGESGADGFTTGDTTD